MPILSSVRKFDESMTDEATITVIATGLEMRGANAAGKIVPKMQYQNMGTVPRPTAPVTPRPAAQAGYTTPGTAKSRASFLWYPETRQPESSVQQMDIKIRFLKNSEDNYIKKMTGSLHEDHKVFV